MLLPSRLKKLWPLLALLSLCQGAAAQDGSAWSEGHRSRVRLVAGGADGPRQLAAVELALQPGFKTYWRNPGESGLPPSFDWAKSTNVEGVDVLWPAPARSEDGGGVSYGYSGGVIFPVRVRPRDPGKPVTLALKIDYGVCKDICIPAQAELSLTLPKDAAPPGRAAIKQALARVPRPLPPGTGGELSVVAAEPMTLGGKSGLTVTVRAPSDSSPRLFVEAPDNWFLLPVAEPRRIGTGAHGKYAFDVAVLERPRGASGAVDLRFTLVAGDKAVETPMSLDAAQLPR
jgi:DsbC/DsbD-like thiol-disulfide interchange protein